MGAQISEDLRRTLKRLRDAPIRYSSEKEAFVLRVDDKTRVTKRGLTRVLKQVFPVPQSRGGDLDEEDEAHPRTVDVNNKPRKSRNDPAPLRRLWWRRKTRLRCALDCKTSTLASSVDGMAPEAGRAGIGPMFNKRHGMLVDQQIRFLVEHGKHTAAACDLVVDPCVSTLWSYLHEQGLCIVATQVPLYSASLDIATALDVLCTDRATRTQLHLLEVKSTTFGADKDRSYVLARGRLTSSTARGTVLSYYVSHQLQLGVMTHMLQEMLGEQGKLTSARVVRVSANCVSDYPLTPWFTERAKALLPAIQKRGVKRRRVNDGPSERFE